MTLPYDVARCFQRCREGLCGTCRRTEPSNAYQQSYILPQIVDGKCVNYIKPQEDPLEWSRKHGIEEV